MYASVLLTCYVIMVFSVTAPVNRSLASCQPSKVGYVIKDFCALYQVLVCVRRFLWWRLDLLIAFLYGGTHSGWLFIMKHFLFWENQPCYLFLFYDVWEPYIIFWWYTTQHPYIWSSVLTSFHPPFRRFFLSRGGPGPSTRRGAGSTQGCVCFVVSCLEDKQYLEV